MNGLGEINDELTFSPLAQLENQMALSNGAARRPLRPLAGGSKTYAETSLSMGASNANLSRAAASNAEQGSIYSFDLVSTNGRLLDRLEFDNEESDPDDGGWLRRDSRSSTMSMQSTGRLLDRLGLEDKPPGPRPLGGEQKPRSLSSLLLLLLGSLARRRSSRKHTPISANSSTTGLNRAQSLSRSTSVVSRNLTNSRPRQPYLSQPPLPQPQTNRPVIKSNASAGSGSSSSSSEESTHEYSVGNVESRRVATTDDNKSIFSFQADMASLESVATISQKIPIPLLPPRPIYPDHDDTSIYVRYPQTSTHRHTHSLPEPNLDQLPQATYQARFASQQPPLQQRLQEELDELDQFEFVNSREASPADPAITRTDLMRTPSAPGKVRHRPLVPGSPSSSLESRHQVESPNSISRRIVSEPIVSHSSSSLSLESASPSRLAKQDLSPAARTNLAIQFRNSGNHREALYQLQLAANMPHNYPKAMYLYAMALRYGQGVKLNERNSIKWLLKCLLVVEHSSSHSQSPSQIEYVSKLADLVPEDLVLIMNRILQREPEIDPVMLYNYYSRLPAAQLSKLAASINSQLNIIASTYHEVGNCLIHGRGIANKDEVMGIMYLSKGASMGDVASMSQLGEMWSVKTKHHKRDLYRASAWLRLSELFGTRSVGNSWIYKDKYIKGKQ